MEIQLNIASITLGAIIAQGLFAALILPFFKNNSKANRFLAILLILFSLWICDTFFRVSGIYNQNPNFYFLPIYFSLAFGPLIYFYTKSLTEKNFKFSKKHLIHFVPVLFQLLFYSHLQLNDYEYRRWFWLEIHQPYTYDLEFILGLISLLIYLGLGLKLVKAYREWIQNNYSDISQIKLTWLRSIYILLFLLSVLWIIDGGLRFLIDHYQETPLSSISIGFSILFLAVGALVQKDLKEVAKETDPEVHKNKSIAQEPIDESLVLKIQQAMETDELFLRNELTLKEFAQELKLAPRKVSQHINMGLQLSFIDFVNSYRVERVKQLIEKGEAGHLSLFGIALESGFNSKPTFNRVFKKFTSKSPSEYQKMIQNRN